MHKQAQIAPFKSKSNAVSDTLSSNLHHFGLQSASKHHVFCIKTACKVRQNTMQYASKQQ